MYLLKYDLAQRTNNYEEMFLCIHTVNYTKISDWFMLLTHTFDGYNIS